MSMKIQQNLLATIAGVQKLNVRRIEESDITKTTGSDVASIGRLEIVLVSVHCCGSGVDHILGKLSEIRMD